MLFSPEARPCEAFRVRIVQCVSTLLKVWNCEQGHCHRGAGGSGARYAPGYFSPAGRARAPRHAGGRNRRAPQTTLSDHVFSSESTQKRQTGQLQAREPLDHLQRQLRHDERPDSLLDGEMLRRPFDITRSAGVRTRASRRGCLRAERVRAASDSNKLQPQGGWLLQTAENWRCAHRFKTVISEPNRSRKSGFSEVLKK